MITSALFIERRRMKHCTHCGTPHTLGNDWPKTCAGCGKTAWRNPIPVAVLLIPCGDMLLGIRRQNTVRAGHLSPPGGFVTSGETWQEAGAREAEEEVCVAIDPKTISLFDTVSTPDGTAVLIFGLTPKIPASALPKFTPNHEASERGMIGPETGLAFPIHQQVIARFFAEKNEGTFLMSSTTTTNPGGRHDHA